MDKPQTHQNESVKKDEREEEEPLSFLLHERPVDPDSDTEYVNLCRVSWSDT